jgi:CCR4-NOT transcription complex subunit 6
MNGFRLREACDELITKFDVAYIFLQEVETEQFYNFFLPELEREGYDGIFSPKSRARTMTEADRKHVDGCAIFYRRSKYDYFLISYLLLQLLPFMYNCIHL